MITAELAIDEKSVHELVKIIDSSSENYVEPDIYEKLLPFRIFRIKDHSIEPVPVYGSEEWNNSTEIFPNKFKIEGTLYESEFIKVKLCRNIQTSEQVRTNFEILFYKSFMIRWR